MVIFFNSQVDDVAITTQHRRRLCALMIVIIAIFVMSLFLGLAMAFIS